MGIKSIKCVLVFTLVSLMCINRVHAQNQADSISMKVDFDEVVITAQYAPTHSKNAVQAIRTITRETIDRQGATNLEQLLQQDLSVRIQQDLVLGSSMSLLGMEGENVKIMIDGVPVIGRLDGNIDLSQINLNNVERIEIVEGPMSVAYGADALAGVINLITKKSQLNDYELKLTQQLESRGENNSMVDAGVRFNDNWLLRLNGGRDRFNGFDQDTLRSSLWNPKEQWYFDASLRRNLGGDHRLRYQLSYFDEEVKNLGELRRPQFKPYAFDDYYLTRRLGHTLAHEGSVGDHFFWQTTLGRNSFERQVNSYRFDFEPENEALTGGDTTAFQSWMARSVFASQFRSDLNFQLGVDLRYENGSGARLEEAGAQGGKIGIGDYALFGSIRFQPINSLMLEGGLRATQNTRYQAPLIPSFHLKYNIGNDWSLRASYGKGFRSPSLKELFLSFIDINHFIIGNPDLEAETSDNVQLNLAFKKKKGNQLFSLRLNTFYNSIKNQILLFPFIERNGEKIPTTPDQSSTFAYFNMSEGKTKGGRLKLGYQYKRLSLEGGVQTIAYYNPTSETVNSVDPFTYTLEFSGKLSYQLPFSGTDLSLFIRHNDRLISYYPEMEDGQTVARQQIQEGFTMMDASLSHSFFNNRLNLSAGVRNLLDIRRVGVSGGGGGVHSGSSEIAPVGPGRSFFVRASISLFDKGAASFVNRPFERQKKQAVQLYEDHEGEVYASWIENRNDEEQVLQFSKWKNKDWTTPRTIAIGDETWFVNEYDAPKLAFFSNKKETMLASWFKNNNPRNAYDHHILMSLSNNEGKRWKPSFMPYQTDVPAYYGLSHFVPLDEDRMLMLWLDGRQTKEKSEADGRYHPKAGTALTLQAVEISPSGKRSGEFCIAEGLSRLCPFDAIALPGGALLAYRNHANDITLRRMENGEWHLPQVLHEDHWTKAATIQGPVLDVIDNKIALAWYSEPEGKPEIKLAVSSNKGEHFSIPQIIKANRPLGYIDLLWISDEVMAASWVEKKSEGAVLMFGILNEQGQILEKKPLADFPETQALVSPKLAKSGREILLMSRHNGAAPHTSNLYELDSTIEGVEAIRFFSY